LEVVQKESVARAPAHVASEVRRRITKWLKQHGPGVVTTMMQHRNTVMLQVRSVTQRVGGKVVSAKLTDAQATVIETFIKELEVEYGLVKKENKLALGGYPWVIYTLTAPRQ
jgi:hypothetical protein